MHRLFGTVLIGCLLSAGAFAQTSNSPGGLTVFETFALGAGADSARAGVLTADMTTQAELFVTSSGAAALGVAIVNPGGTAASISLTLRRGDGTIRAASAFAIGGGQQIAQFISEMFPGVPELQTGFDGSLLITSDNLLAIMGLRFFGTNFSTVPITSLSLPASVPQVTANIGGRDAAILPQFAAGENWSSEIVMSNATDVPLTVRIDLFGQDGAPLTTNLNGQTGSSFPKILIPANGVFIEATETSGPLQVGYVIVTPIDTIPPTVTSTIPANADFTVPTNQKVTFSFSKPMDLSTINPATFALIRGSAAVPGALTFSGTTAIFTPAAPLAPGTTYTGSITTGATDLAGTQLASSFVWTFTTGVLVDTTQPTVSSTVPATAATSVHQKVAATFSKAMDPTTINITTFTLNIGGVPVAGTVSYAGQTATFAANADLAGNTTYTAAILTGAKDLAGNSLANTYMWSFTTSAVLDTSAPTATLTVPANGATGAAVNAKVAVTFSEAMDPLSITTSTFSVAQGVTPITGTVAYVGYTATFSPLNNLAPNTTYTATITTAARDLSDNALANSFLWSFSTGGAADRTPPTVISTDPVNGAAGVAINKKIVAVFSKLMDPARITNSTFLLQQGASNMPGTVTYLGTTATFAPANNLAANTTYTATITTGASDLAENAMAGNFVWSFTSGALTDTTPPAVLTADPSNGATGVATNETPSVVFSKSMDPLTMTTGYFTVRGPGVTSVPGVVTYDAVHNTATFTPFSSLQADTVFIATIKAGARDLAGNTLASDFVWSFATRTSQISLLAAVSLAGAFPSAQMVYADATRIYLCSFEGALFVLARDRTSNFSLIQVIAVGPQLTAIRGDSNDVYVTGNDGNLYVFAKTVPLLQLTSVIPLSTDGLAAVEPVSGNVYVGKGEASMFASGNRLYLSETNPGDFAVEVGSTNTYGGTNITAATTMVFDLQTRQQVAALLNPGGGFVNINGWGSSLYLTTPGCCSGGVFIYDAATLNLTQHLSQPMNVAAGVQIGAKSLLVGGDEYGNIDLYAVGPAGYAMIDSAPLRTITGFTAGEDIEIRALWVDGIDNLIFAASSGGNDQSRAIGSLPTFFVLEIL